jgi:hypothetical protein
MSNVFLDRIEAVLTGLPTDAPLHDVYDALSDFAEEDVAAVLATRSLTAGGGTTNLYYGADDPGAVGAWKLWVDTSGNPGVLKQRNGDDDLWSFVNVERLDATGAINSGNTVTASDELIGTFHGDFSTDTVFVTSQVGAPDPLDTYITPLVYDSTAVTGGCYAWGGSQYIKVGNVVA